MPLWNLQCLNIDGSHILWSDIPNNLRYTHLLSKFQNTQVGTGVSEYGNVTLTGGEMSVNSSGSLVEWRNDDNTGPSNDEPLWSPGNALPRKPDRLRYR